ncbi:4825_t:CDS:1 [Cetraspora pellucida]|uniref:4825_t:CDS:1 n=1 Tax=Cetraspora pellucida TaxID=1433469 RepID=A0ACA9M5Y1_9GLOM|nr:4825_t:CDS:1 [Cetraspora pellucida]
MEGNIFEETVEEKIFGDFSFDQYPFFTKNKYDVVDIRQLTCKFLHKIIGKEKHDPDKFDKIMIKMSKIFEVHIISTIGSNDNINNDDDMDRLEGQIIEHLSLDITKLAKLFAAFSTEIINSDKYGMIDLRPYKLSGINTSVLNAGIFSRAGNQVKLFQIINYLKDLNANFFEEYNKRIKKNLIDNKTTLYIMINSIASNLTPFGTNHTTFDKPWLDENISFAQLLYRNLGGIDMVKQHAFDRFDPAILPTLTEMHRNTIKFIPSEDSKLIFEFDKDKNTVIITKLYIHPHWMETLWNLVMLEMRSKCEPIVGTVTCFYTGVIKTKEDFNLAYQLGMIYSGPMNFPRFHEIMCKISEVSHYNSTLKGTNTVRNLVSTVEALQNNTLLQLYIISGGNVWIRIVNISATIILVLTTIQTVISVLSYKISLEQMNSCE